MDDLKYQNSIFVLILAVIVAFFYFPSPQYIFQMHDDYVYPAAAKQLLTEGQMHWAGGKPGIALLAAVAGATSPYSILFLYLFCGALTALFLFLLLRRFDISYALAAAATLLWISSPYFFYYSKTHHVVCVAFYLSGLYFCWRGIQEQKINLYRLGSFLLGWSLLTYYLFTVYMPFLYLFFLYCWYQRGRSIISIIINSAVPFLMPIAIFDAAVVGAYFIWGKKTWPVMYSFFGTCKWLSATRAPVNFSIPVWFDVLVQAEMILIFLLLILLVAAIALRVLYKKEQMLFMLVLFIPLCFWFMQHLLGSFSALRSLLGVLPFIYGAIVYFSSRIIPVRFHYIVLGLILPCVGYRLYANQKQLSPQLKTAYSAATTYINKLSASVVVYAGQKKLWEQLLEDKIIIPLNVCNDPLEVLHNRFLWNTLLCKLHEYIEQAGSVALVVSHTSKENLELYKECFATEFVVTLQQTFSDPHLANFFWFSEHDIPLIQAQNNAHPLLYIFTLTKK